LRKVQIGRNLGEETELLDGIGANDRVVLNPTDSLADGDVVALAAPASAAPAKGTP